jgi:hypothetical protein
MFRLLLALLRWACQSGRVNSDCLHRSKPEHRVITPEGFGY